jgi:hypothetical protein
VTADKPLSDLVSRPREPRSSGWTRRSTRSSPRARCSKKVAGDFGFTEGPIWADGTIRFSDLTGNKLYEIGPDGKPKLLLDKSGGKDTIPPGSFQGSNGSVVDQDGSVLMGRHGARDIVRTTRNPDGSLTVDALPVEERRRRPVQQPQRHGLRARRLAVDHRSALRHARPGQGPGQGSQVQRRLPLQGRQDHRGDHRPSRARTASASRRTARSSTSPTASPTCTSASTTWTWRPARSPT